MATKIEGSIKRGKNVGTTLRPHRYPEGTLWLAPLGLKKTIKESQTNRQSWLLSGKAIRYA